MTVRGLALVVPLWLAAGCAVGPSTRAAPVAAPAVTDRSQGATRSAARTFVDSLTQVREAEGADTTWPTLWRPRPLALDSAGDLPWLAVLKDSQLVVLVQRALASNRDLRTATARVEEFRASVGVARSNLLPRLDLNSASSTNKVILGTFPPVHYDAVTLTGNVQWELDFWGRLRRQTEAAGLDWRAQEQDRRAAVLSLVSDVATAYLELRELDDDLRISQQTLVTRRATLELARKRFSQGVISDLDVSQFESAVAAPAASVADFTRQRVQKENQLRLLIGAPAGSIERGGPLEAAVQAVSVPDSVPASVLARRPDVLRAQRDWQAATARIGVAIGDRLPSFFISAQYGTQRPSSNGLFDRSGEIYTVQGGVSLPLFRGGSLVNAERAARARADQARSQYEQSMLTAIQEASDALAGVRLGRDQIVAQQTQVQALRRARKIAERRYANGISSYLEVLDAQRSLFDAELSLAQVQRQYLAATVQLYRALGGGWTR